MRVPYSLLLLAPLLSCGEVKALKLRIDRLEDEVKRVERRAFCPQEVKQLLEDVWKNTQCSVDQLCVSQLIARTVGALDPTGHGRFLSLMSSQPYAVFYPEYTEENGKYTFTFGPRERSVRDRLRRLVFPPWLPITKFLLVSNTGPDKSVVRASGRIQFLLKELSQLSFEPEFSRDVYRFDGDKPVCLGQNEEQSGGLRLLRWAFYFTLRPGEQLGIFDQPPTTSISSPKPVVASGKRKPPGKEQGAPPPAPVSHGIDDAIFVFRIDCPLMLTDAAPSGAAK